MRLWGNAQWAKGQQAGVQWTQDRDEKDFKKRYEKLAESIEVDKKAYRDGVLKNESDSRLLQKAITEAERSRKASEQMLAQILARAAANSSAGYSVAANLPDADLVESVRKISKQLELERLAGDSLNPK
jgi:ABC-type lipoprotein release transport system permease subunit